MKSDKHYSDAQYWLMRGQDVLKHWDEPDDYFKKSFAKDFIELFNYDRTKLLGECVMRADKAYLKFREAQPQVIEVPNSNPNHIPVDDFHFLDNVEYLTIKHKGVKSGDSVHFKVVTFFKK